jgi:hypothetical protein
MHFTLESRNIDHWKTLGEDEIHSGKGHQYFPNTYEMDSGGGIVSR